MNSAGNYETFLISWKFDIDGQIMTDDFNVTKDMLKLQNPVVTRFSESVQDILIDVQSGGKSLKNLDNIFGKYDSFDIAWEEASKNIG